MTRASSNTLIPAASEFEANVERMSEIRAGLRTPDASIAGCHSRRRKLARSNGPPRFAANMNALSNLGGISSSAPRARVESGTWRRLRFVLPSSTQLAGRDRGAHGQHTAMAVDVAPLERTPLLRPQPVAAANIGSGLYAGCNSAAIASSSSVVNGRTARGGG